MSLTVSFVSTVEPFNGYTSYELKGDAIAMLYDDSYQPYAS
jgi:hypothetical protein